MSTVTTSNNKLIGRVKKMVRFPSDMITLLLKFDSAIGPKINPSIIGPKGIPRKFNMYPITPKKIIIHTSKILFCREYVPTILNKVIVGSK